MIETVQPLPQYLDTDGKPLDGGFVYFGISGQNPETSPITVYWDLAATQPAAQPLRTSGGYIMRSGTPARVYSAGDHSVTVRDKKGRQVYSALSSTELAVLLSSTESGNGAARVGYERGTTVDAELKRIGDNSLYLDDPRYGVVGNGIADDTVAIQDVLNYAGTLGNAKVIVPHGRDFLFSSTLSIPSGVVLAGESGRRGIHGLKSNVIGAPSINIANGYYQAIHNINLYHVTPASAGTGVQIIDNDGVGTGTDPAQYFEMSNCRIVGHSTGVRIAHESTWCNFVDVIVEQGSGPAFSLTNANLTIFDRCIADNCTIGWYLDSTTKTILNACTAQVCSDLTNGAVTVLNCDNVEINHLWCERNQFHNVHIRGTSRLTRITEMLNQGAGTTSGTGRGIYITGTASNTTIDGGWHGNNATEDITIDATTTNTVVINPRSTTALTMTDNSTTSQHYGRGQVRFPSTQNASSNVNTLDDYKEGNFSPVIIGTTTAGTGTYANATGRYTKIGRVVTFTARINMTAHTGTGNMVLGGLPFTSENVAGLRQAVCIAEVSGLTLPASSDVCGYIAENTTQIVLNSRSTAGGSVSEAALALDTAFIIAVSGSYITPT